ncbi:MAG: hypothetical protein IKS41_03415 [Alphaproteobacteria bacterium]|nr:hypothetical protein [Alphaproteobacteria bacterium]
MLDFSTVCIFLLLFSVIGLRGLCVLIKSPAIFRMDREKNSCTKETKYIWQKDYKIKNLCKLSEVKEATRKGEIFSPFNVLYLKLKSGKDIAVFFAPHNGCWSYMDYTREFNQMKDKINSFLANNDKGCIIENSLIGLGIISIVISFCAILFLSFVIFYST